jgi:SAM-dependent methyltransferase
MAERGTLRQLGSVFDGVAEAYDAARPSYPPELVDAAIASGRLGAASRILEIGCGTGKLTELLVDRGLRVHAIEPGANLVEAAQRRIGDSTAVEYEIAKFEAAEIADGAYDAVFSATAFHWVDPEIGWAKVARILAPGGLFALLTHVGLEDEDERSEAMELELIELLIDYTPGRPEDWKLSPPFDEFLAGARARSADITDAWDWVMSRGRHGLAVPEAAPLFTDVQIDGRLLRDEYTADQVLAHMRTTSLWFMVDADRRDAFEHDYRSLIERCGGTFPFSDGAFLLTARRAARPAST